MAGVQVPCLCESMTQLQSIVWQTVADVYMASHGINGTSETLAHSRLAMKRRNIGRLL
jgi:hypothetical protein